MTSKPDINCPTCNKENTWREDNPYRPFCSERCKLIDFGSWAMERHRVPGESVDTHELPDDEGDESGEKNQKE